MTIETICILLLDALSEAGFNESEIFNYKGVTRRFKTFRNEKGVTDYTPEIELKWIIQAGCMLPTDKYAIIFQRF